jgi:hypothetical protein
MGIPADAVKMFRASNQVSGINVKTLPAELLPLNSIQLSRGLLNFTFIQSRLNWVYPYWINEQYNHAGGSFIPRSHAGLSINVTNRNWTAVGNVFCPNEPIIDPRGLVTPFKNGWSVDTWLKIDEELFIPSISKISDQYRDENLPIVVTEFSFDEFDLKLTAYTHRSTFYHTAEIKNNSKKSKRISLIFSIRPFNPEGISLLNKISFNRDDCSFKINDTNQIYFVEQPDRIICSDFNKGDVLELITNKSADSYQTDCSCGIATAAAILDFGMMPGEISTTRYKIPLDNNKELNLIFSGKEEAKREWEAILTCSTEIKTPDDKINSVIKASLTTVLMFCDENTVTPGPFTYHQFWFRDAAYMLFALDKFGCHKFSQKIIESFSNHQMNDGYFRSQKGEWDSNGQAVWTMHQHSLLTSSTDILLRNFKSLVKGIKWIDNKRIKNPKFESENFYGLLPKGLSAEHLGLADYYYWDNFWSIAGIKSFISVCEILQKEKEQKYAEKLLSDYNSDLTKSLKNIRQKFKTDAIPASSQRGIDGGMIGSISALYPLQIFPPRELIETLYLIENNYFHKGLFFQQFIHSGGNPYLTLQTAHSYLFSGNREKFFEIFSNVISYASPTLNFPEAIHPATGGGVMGDGHHGWAASEILSAVRDAFVFEKNIYSSNNFELVLLSGIPREWFDEGKNIHIKNAPVYGGKISIACSRLFDRLIISIEYKKVAKDFGKGWRIIIPFNAKAVYSNDSEHKFELLNEETVIDVYPHSCEITILL